MRTRRLAMLAGILALLTIPSIGWADRATDYYSSITKTASVSSAQSATTLWTPASGFRIALLGCTISARHAQQVKLQVSSVDVVPTMFFESYGIKTIGASYSPIYVGAADAVLTYTTSSTADSSFAPETSIICWGYEWKG